MSTVLDIKGHQDDSSSDKTLDKRPTRSTVTAKLHQQHGANVPNTDLVMDGVRWRKSKSLAIPKPNTKTAPTIVTTKTIAPPTPIRVEKSQTLIRRIVKKPFYTKKVTPISQKPVEQNSNTHKFFGHTPVERLARAGQVSHNTSISRYGTANHKIPSLSNNLKMAQPPKVQTTVPTVPPVLFPTRQLNQKQPVVSSSRTKINFHSDFRPIKDRLYRRTLSHLRVSLKAVTIGCGIVIIALIAGIIIYNKVPAIDMKIADYGAGFNGHVPSLIPAGFSFKEPITYQKNIIALQYKSDINNNQFAIVQKPSNWSSTSLAANYLTNAGLQYQTYADPNGLTIYIFGAGQATWVDSGIWYTINSHNSLSTDQILAIAGSM